MKLVNMKIDTAAREARYKEASEAKPTGPVYPYGLCVRLDDDAMAALKMGELPAAGDELVLLAKVTVSSVSENQYDEGGKTRTRQSMELQITDMALEKQTVADAAKTLFGE